MEDNLDTLLIYHYRPNLDGIQSTKKIREMGFSAPIVALTAFAEKSNEEECLNSGMDYFLAKPIRRPALKQVLKKYCPTIPEEEEAGGSYKAPIKNKHAKKESTGLTPRHATPSERKSPGLRPQRQGSPRGRPNLNSNLDSGYDSNEISPLS